MLLLRLCICIGISGNNISLFFTWARPADTCWIAQQMSYIMLSWEWCNVPWALVSCLLQLMLTTVLALKSEKGAVRLHCVVLLTTVAGDFRCERIKAAINQRGDESDRQTLLFAAPHRLLGPVWNLLFIVWGGRDGSLCVKEMSFPPSTASFWC